MEHSITSLATQARVTIRTLRHYDKIGLLKPSIRMTNGRRIYNDEEAMRLYEIVYLKKIGISLPKIKEIYRSKNFSQAVAAALIERQQALAKEMKKLQRYTGCIDIALPLYKNCNMNRKERLEKFNLSQNKMKEIENLQIQQVGKEAVKAAKRKVETLSDEKVDDLTDQCITLMKEFVKAVEKNLDPASKEVQKLIKWNYEIMAEFQVVTKEILVKLRDNLLEQREYYLAYHPKLPEFLYEAMDVFIKHFKDKRKNKTD